MSSKEHSTKYRIAPISEVVCGVIFKQPILKFDNKIIEILNKYRTEFQEFLIQPALLDESLQNDIVVSGGDVNLIGQIRYWLRKNDGKNLIQLQNNKLFYNWTRTDFEHTGSYPGFDQIFSEFYRLFSNLGNDSGSIEFQQRNVNYYDLLYQDRIFYFDYIPDLSQLNKIININVPELTTRPSVNRINNFSYQIIYSLKEVGGYVRMTLRTGIAQNGKQALIIESNIRGRNEDQCLKEWFKEANRLQVNIFEELFQPNILESWK